MFPTESWSCMRSKSPIIVIAFLLSVCMSGKQVVIAGGSATSSATVNARPESASVKGVVKFEGTAPKPRLINMAADPSCARQHPTPVAVEDIVTDTNGGLENVVVFIADGLGDRTFDPPTQPAVIEQKGCMYRPHVVAVRANQKLDVVNSDPTTHNIHPLPTNNREWNKAEPPGSTVEDSFAREEIAIPLKCDVHPWMRSYVAVFKHPNFAVTRKGGGFDLANLPPGTYTIEAWHEKLGTAIQKITLGGNETKTVEFVFKPRPGS